MIRDINSHILKGLERAALGDYSFQFYGGDESNDLADVLIALDLTMADLNNLANKETSLRNEYKKRAQRLELQTFVLEDTKTALKKVVFDLNKERTALKTADEQLKKKVAELERFNNIMIGRELKMVELKKEIAKLKSRSK